MTEQATLEKPRGRLEARAPAERARDVLPCPECHRVAEVVDRFHLESTDGPVPHVRLRCEEGRHHLMMPAASVMGP